MKHQEYNFIVQHKTVQNEYEYFKLSWIQIEFFTPKFGVFCEFFIIIQTQ